MSTLGSLYIKLGEPEGEITSCCDLSEWAAQKIEEQHESMLNLPSEPNCFRGFYIKTLSPNKLEEQFGNVIKRYEDLVK